MIRPTVRPPAAHHRAGWLATVVLVVLAGSPAHGARRIDPALSFLTVRTPHFDIHYQRELAALAGRLSVVAERVWLEVPTSLRLPAPNRTHVILVDQAELANGWATPLPYNSVLITAASPPGSEFIGATDDWLSLVFTHEFTHVVHLDQSRGWARWVRKGFGRTPLAFPNLFLPAWSIEGLAVWQESRGGHGGRRAAGDFRAIESLARAAGRTEPLDRINGALTDWPAGNAPYVFGLGFHEYLATRFGADRFGDLYRATAGRVPYTAAPVFARVFGVPLSQLWNDYTASISPTSTEHAGVEDRAGTHEPIRLTTQGHVALGPQFVPGACPACPPRVAYSRRTPHTLPTIEVVGLDAGQPLTIATRYLGSSLSLARDGRLLFDQQEIKRNVGLYADLYALDPRSGRVTRIVGSQRLQDADVSPDGRTVVAVKETGGARRLVVADFDGRRVSHVRELGLTPLEPSVNEAFSAPRWSPDGRTIVAARWRLGVMSELVLVDVATGQERLLASSTSTRHVTPIWTPDGEAVIAGVAPRDAPFDLYQFPLDGLPARRLTKLPGGAIWPALSPDRRTLVFVSNTVDGFDLFAQPFDDGHGPARDEAAGVDASRLTLPDSGATTNAASTLEPPDSLAGGTSYRPSGLAPTSWFPVVSLGIGTRVGAATFGADVLGRHAWSVESTALVAAQAGATLPSRRTPDFAATYTYSRWRPELFVVASRTTAFYAEAASGQTVTHRTASEVEAEAGVYFPVHHVRASHRVLASVATVASRDALSPEAPSRRRTSYRAGIATHTAHQFGYSISPERGVTLGATTEIIDYGSALDRTVTASTAQVRGYLPGFGRHHVVALRAGAGFTQPSGAVFHSFALGGASPAPDVLSGGVDALALLRGFSDNSYAGTRVGVMNAEYRFPLMRPERGRGLWPVSVESVHAATFVDAGHAWIDRATFRDAKTSVGLEVSSDIVLGYSYPITVTSGVAWGRDGGARAPRASGYVVYGRVGRSF